MWNVCICSIYCIQNALWQYYYYKPTMKSLKKLSVWKKFSEGHWQFFLKLGKFETSLISYMMTIFIFILSVYFKCQDTRYILDFIKFKLTWLEREKLTLVLLLWLFGRWTCFPWGTSWCPLQFERKKWILKLADNPPPPKKKQQQFLHCTGQVLQWM